MSPDMVGEIHLCIPPSAPPFSHLIGDEYEGFIADLLPPRTTRLYTFLINA